MAGRKKLAKSPKMKTNRSAAKRFTVTGSGQIKFQAKGRRHCLSNKSRKRKRQLVKSRYLSASDMALVERQIPYLG